MRNRRFQNTNITRTFIDRKSNYRWSKSCARLFCAGTAGYLAYDFYYHPNSNERPNTSKKILYLPDRLFNVRRFTEEELSKKELKVRHGLIYRADTEKPS